MTPIAEPDGNQYRAVFTNPAGTVTSTAATLTVNPVRRCRSPPRHCPGGPSTATAAVNYAATLTASGGNPPYTWSIAGGSLPPGLKLARTGAISGKATTAGTYDFTAQVLDTRTKTTPSTQRVATAQLSITVVPAPLQVPAVTRVSPATGPGAGGTKVTITGTGLTGATSVTFGSVAAASYTVNAAGTSITAYSPPEAAGAVDVVVTTAGGVSAASSADRFTFEPPNVTRISPHSGPLGGGTKVIIGGTGFTGATSVMFGSVAAASYTVNTAGTSITAYSPPEGAGSVDVVVTTPGGASATPSDDTAAFLFTFG